MVQEPTPPSIIVEGKTFPMAVPKSRVWRSRMGFCVSGELRSYSQNDGISSKQCPASQVTESQNMTSFENGIIVAVVREDDVKRHGLGPYPSDCILQQTGDVSTDT